MNSGIVNFPISYPTMRSPIVTLTGLVSETMTHALCYYELNKITQSSFNLLSSSGGYSYSKFVISVGW